MSNANDADRTQQYRTGEFEGRAFNTTAKQPGKTVLELYDFDPASHKVRAYIGFSDGLTGESWTSGTVSDAGDFYLSGPLSNYRMEISGSLAAGGAIHATYRLEGKPPQEGKFDVSFQHALPLSTASMHDNQHGAPDLADLVGPWEVGGGMPAPINPVTGIPTGISFVEARRFEVLPDGQFKYLQSHRHCNGAGVATCCTETAVMQEGTLSLDGSQLDLNISGGGSIARDNCNPALNQQSALKPSRQTYEWSIKSGSNGSGRELCLRMPDGSWCFNKQQS